LPIEYERLSTRDFLRTQKIVYPEDMCQGLQPGEATEEALELALVGERESEGAPVRK
jgi:hypothetical protein